METLMRRLLDLIIIFVLWLLLTWSFDVQGVLAGAIFEGGLTAREAIPACHKIALRAIAEG